MEEPAQTLPDAKNIRYSKVISILSEGLSTEKESNKGKLIQLNKPTPELANLVEYSKKALISIYSEIKNDDFLRSLYTKVWNHLKHVSLDFIVKDKDYPHASVFKGKYPYYPTLETLQKTLEFFKILSSAQKPKITEISTQESIEKELLEKQKQLAKEIVNEPLKYYQLYRNRLEQGGAQASFPELAPVVKYLQLKLLSDSRIINLCKTNSKFAIYRAFTLAHLKEIESSYPYVKTIRAIERAVEFLDVFQRVKYPEKVANLFHSDRYELFISSYT